MSVARTQTLPSLGDRWARVEVSLADILLLSTAKYGEDQGGTADKAHREIASPKMVSGLCEYMVSATQCSSIFDTIPKMDDTLAVAAQAAHAKANSIAP